MKLSIITVNLNNLEGLKKTYENVVCQTFTDYEWLVIDGGSTDGSREFIEQHKDKFAYWCSEPDKGIYNAMNKGIMQAKGEYLNFMNSGDCFACEETLAGVFGKERTADILYGYMKQKCIDGEYLSPRTMKNKVSWYDLYESTFPHQASFIKRELFNKVGLYDENFKVTSDWKWFAMALLHHKASYDFVPCVLAIYEGGGISQKSGEDEVIRMKGTIFPDYIGRADAVNLGKVSIIQSFKLTNFLYKVLGAIAWRLEFLRRKHVSDSLSANFN